MGATLVLLLMKPIPSPSCTGLNTVSNWDIVQVCAGDTLPVSGLVV